MLKSNKWILEFNYQSKVVFKIPDKFNKVTLKHSLIRNFINPVELTKQFVSVNGPDYHEGFYPKSTNPMLI